jgi:hypothetical protein
MCSSIKKLNLKNNLIQDEENIQFLSNLTDLKWLNLTNNPISKNENYTELIKENLPWLESLDKEEEKLQNQHQEDESMSIINDDKRFFESQSTFSSSPCSQKTNNRPVSSNTSSNFFNSNQKFKISEDNLNLNFNLNIDQGEDNILSEMSNLNLMSKTNKNFFNNGVRLQTAKLKLNTGNLSQKNSPEKIIKNQEDLSPNKPWNLPDNPVFNFNLQSETARGKSQNPLTKKEFSQTMSGFSGFNKNSLNSNQPTLRPVMVKKDKPIEIKSFKKTVEDELISQEIMKNLDKNSGKGFKLNPFSESKGSVNLLKNLIPVRKLIF